MALWFNLTLILSPIKNVSKTKSTTLISYSNKPVLECQNVGWTPADATLASHPELQTSDHAEHAMVINMTEHGSSSDTVRSVP